MLRACCLLMALASSLRAQVHVRDSLGAPVPFAILEAPDGRRAVAGPDGSAPTLRVGDGPWSARRIGYRPARDDDGDGVIVMGRMPLALPARVVAAAPTCRADGVAARADAAVLDAIRTIFGELVDRRQLAVSHIPFEVSTRFFDADGNAMEGTTDTIPAPVRPRDDVFVSGQVIRRTRSGWQVVRPGPRDIVSPPFLEAHCLTIETTADGARSALHFEPIADARGAQVAGTFVIDRTSGRLVADSLRYRGAPRGAPKDLVEIGEYEPAPETRVGYTVPARIRSSLEPDGLVLRGSFGRRRIVRLEQRWERLPFTEPSH